MHWQKGKVHIPQLAKMQGKMDKWNIFKTLLWNQKERTVKSGGGQAS